MLTRSPTSRRDRPAKAPLTREAVVGAALQVMAEEGLERVTMRRLAALLDTGPASLYVYVSNTAELHGALLDELLTQIELPAADGAGPWRDRLVDLLIAYTQLLLPLPSLARSVLMLRPSGPHYLRLIDAALAMLLTEVPARQAAWGLDLLLQQATAIAAEQGTRDTSVEAVEEEDALQLAVDGASGETYPSIVAVRDDLLSGTGAQRLHWAFSALIAGIAHVPTPADPAGSASETPSTSDRDPS